MAAEALGSPIVGMENIGNGASSAPNSGQPGDHRRNLNPEQFKGLAPEGEAAGAGEAAGGVAELAELAPLAAL